MNKEKLEEARNYIRLNTKKLTDIHKLLVEVNVELFDLVFDIPELKRGNFRLFNVSNSHNAPIGKRTNWGERNKDYPTHFPGWTLMNTKGTLRTRYGNKPKDSHIKDHNIKYITDTFWTINIHSFHHGINTGTFNGGPNFMGCFYFFIDDFPHIKENIECHFDKDDIMNVYKIRDWVMYLRNKKLIKLRSKFQTEC